MKNCQIAVIILGALILASCSATYITSTWKAPGIDAAKYKKIMVVGVIREADRTIREKMENHLTDDLKLLGYDAVSSFAKYGPKAFEGMNEMQVMDQLKKEKIDAVLTIVLLDKEKERHYVPGRVVFSPYITYHSRFWGYYRSLYMRIEEPGYYTENTKYFWESNLYDLSDSKLLYSVQTQSFESSSVNTLAHEYGQKIIEAMIREKVIIRKEDKLARSL